jgi:hypothetical protein
MRSRSRATRTATLELDGRPVRLTNLDKPFWPALGLAKREYYAAVATVLLPHLVERAMVMKHCPAERLGPHAGLGLLGAADAGRDGVDAVRARAQAPSGAAGASSLLFKVTRMLSAARNTCSATSA